MFRCHGLDDSSARGDLFGLHDVAWWLVFVVALCAWFLLLFAPQRERLDNLTEREQTLRGHMFAEKRELARLHRSIDELTRNDPYAWERAARGRLGWVEPGELTDLVAWTRTHNIHAPYEPPPCQQNGARLATPPQMQLPAIRLPGALPRPQIPTLPVPPGALGKPKLVVAAGAIDPEALGLIRGTPPPLPPPIRPPAARNPAHPTALPVVLATPRHTSIPISSSMRNARRAD